MTQQNTHELGERLSAKLRAFFDTLDPEEKAAMARFLSTPVAGAEDVKGYGFEEKNASTQSILTPDAVLDSVVFDLAGYVNTVMSAEATSESVINPQATTGSVSHEVGLQ